jgi:hypothetical protein
MARRTRTRPSNRARPKRTSITADRETAPVRISSKPTLIEPFHVAVDRQLKSGHDTYEAAEKAALVIKKLYPKLHVTVYDAKNQRHTVVEQPKPVGASNKTRLAAQAARDAPKRRKVPAAGAKH